MIIKVLWIIMWCIIIFTFGFFTGYVTLRSKIYGAMTKALDNVSVKENGADYVRGVIHACKKIDEAIKK